MQENSKGKKRFAFKGLKSFSVFDLVLLAMLTAVSVAFKTVVGILVRMITGPLGVPGGALAGGFYMLWLPLSIILVGKRGSALVIAAVQTIVMITTGAPGSHGVWTIFTYMLPAILVEAVFIYRPKNGYNILHFIISTIFANMAGTFGSNLLFFRMSVYPLLFTLLAAALSGALGGGVAYFVYVKVVKSGVLSRLKNKTSKKHNQEEDFDVFGDNPDTNTIKIHETDNYNIFEDISKDKYDVFENNPMNENIVASKLETNESENIPTDNDKTLLVNQPKKINRSVKKSFKQGKRQ